MQFDGPPRTRLAEREGGVAGITVNLFSKCCERLAVEKLKFEELTDWGGWRDGR